MTMIAYEANAAFIVKCVNVHDSLLASLKTMLAEYEAWKGWNDDGFEDETLAMVREAITKAEASS